MIDKPWNIVTDINDVMNNHVLGLCHIKHMIPPTNPHIISPNAININDINITSAHVNLLFILTHLLCMPELVSYEVTSVFSYARS